MTYLKCNLDRFNFINKKFEKKNIYLKVIIVIIYYVCRYKR